MVSAFQDQVVLNYRRGAFQSQLRETHRAVFNHAAKIAVKGTDHINGVRALDDKVQLRLWEIKEKVETQKKQGQVAEFIQKHQAEPIFVDELKLIEIVGKDKKGLMFGMHVNVLEKGIMDGTIVADKGFNFRKGGKILCPVHGDTNPSMDVSFSRNRFICWTCGTGGWFVPGSVPADIQMAVRPRIKRDAYDTLMLPPRHQEIMKYAQVILQRNFLGSPAINYLSKERKLDPNLAFQVGAGYGNIDLIVSLLDLGFGYDELIHYGFLQISAGISQHTELVGNLLKKGLKLQELVRIVPGNRKRGIPDKPGLPYSVLDKRVTCPLEIKDTINNFYGRSVDLNCPKPLRHRKLPTDLCGEIPHGAFNMFRAAENAMRTDQKLIVVEAPLNAITLIQASDVKNVTAIMGVNNDVLFELLASFEGDIITAFDLDPEKFDKNKRQVGLAGQISTIKLRDTLRELDFHGKMNDFTIGFTQKEGLTCDLLPDGRKPHNYFNDINQYWVDHKEPFRILDYIQEIPKQLVWGSTKYPPDT